MPEIKYRLQMALRNRKYLDEFFKTTNCRRDIKCIRDFCMTRLVSFVEWNPNRDTGEQLYYDGNFPTDNDLHLSMFFHFMFDKHPCFKFKEDWITLFDSNYRGAPKDVNLLPSPVF